MLVRLLYASRAVEGIDAELLESILSRSRANNPEIGVTGILCYSGDLFMQVLEGGRREVSRLFATIVRDPRHSDVELLSFEEIGERRFAGWTMGQVNLARINPGTLLKFSEKPVLDPFAASGKMTMALLDELIATAAIALRAS